MNEITQAGTALAVIPPSSLPTIIAADTDDILGKLAKKVQAFRQDVSTSTGRAEMRSLAHEIAVALASLDRLGKGLTEGWRKSTAAVNAERRLLEERMRELQEKVRAPLTAWENAEKDRVAAHEALISKVQGTASFDGTWCGDVRPEDINNRIAWLNSLENNDWQEFKERGVAAVTDSIASLCKLRSAVAKQREEAAELERLRAEQEARDRLAAIQEQERREERIAAEAAAKAKADAEAKAKADRLTAELKAHTERQAIERQKQEAELAVKRAQEAAAQAERDRADAVAKAEQDRLAAEQRAEIAKAEAKQALQAAIEVERKRLADAKAAEEAEDKRRAADKQHRAEFNREALSDLVAAGVSDAHARIVIAHVAKGIIRHMGMRY